MKSYLLCPLFFGYANLPRFLQGANGSAQGQDRSQKSPIGWVPRLILGFLHSLGLLWCLERFPRWCNCFACYFNFRRADKPFMGYSGTNNMILNYKPIQYHTVSWERLYFRLMLLDHNKTNRYAMMFPIALGWHTNSRMRRDAQALLRQKSTAVLGRGAFYLQIVWVSPCSHHQ